MAFWTLGKAFPRADRSPTMVPHAFDTLHKATGGRLRQIERKHIQQLGPGWLPFADAASEGLPLGQLLRLGLFQVSVGMATVLLLGTLNRVMIVELSVPAMIVALMIALPVLSAPFRALLGFRSDTHRSAIGWKRIPYLWFGSLWQMGGFAIMPFAPILLGGDQVL
eukprot:gene18484-22622_t